MNIPQISKSFYETIKTTFNIFPSTYISAWKTNTNYKKGQRIKYFDIEFECIKDHISSDNFENDSKYWKYPSKMSLIK